MRQRLPTPGIHGQVGWYPRHSPASCPTENTCEISTATWLGEAVTEQAGTLDSGLSCTTYCSVGSVRMPSRELFGVLHLHALPSADLWISPMLYLSSRVLCPDSLRAPGQRCEPTWRMATNTCIKPDEGKTHRHEGRENKTQRRFSASGRGQRALESTAGMMGKGVSWCCAVKPGGRGVCFWRKEEMRDVRECEPSRKHHQRKRIITR